MPRMHGLEVLKQVKGSSPQTRAIVLSMHNDEPYVIEALRAGAVDCIDKNSAEFRQIAVIVQRVHSRHDEVELVIACR